MIRYALRCACAHGFDAWFASAAAYDAQAEAGLVSCPACGANTVEKAPMAPAIARRRPQAASAETAEAPSPASPAPEPANHPHAVRAALQAMVRDVKSRAEDVGMRFAEEARRIHNGEAEARPIRGRASGEDARALEADGIPVYPLPDVPEHDA